MAFDSAVVRGLLAVIEVFFCANYLADIYGTRRKTLYLSDYIISWACTVFRTTFSDIL